MRWAGGNGGEAWLVQAAIAVAVVSGCADDPGATGDTQTSLPLVTDTDTGSTGDTSTTAPTTTAPTTGEPEQPCGNGKVDPGETCDDGNLDNSDACLNSCVLATCGDGFVQLGAEECDDGNTDNSDTCTALCQKARCGDGFVQLGVEECDDGNKQDDDGCTTACVIDTAMLCGNGELDPGEECDDGNDADDDNCPSTCVAHHCGDGFVHAVFEECDDGNDADDDACVGCLHAVCGDGYLHAGVEACDDGNPDNGDDCLKTCELASCGDGFVHKTDEVCDDGVNDGSYGGCQPDCAALAPHCGDGDLFDQVETCDDGNLTDLDGCDAMCQLELPPECIGYTALGDADRHFLFNDGPGGVTKCDKMMGGKWYRFVDAAGTKIATTLPKHYACGTDSPGYMLGTHPTPDDGVVDRQVCFLWDTDCDWQATIQVRNCGDFYVYKLADPPEVCLRYCGHP